MGAPDVLARLAAAGVKLSPLPDGRLSAEPADRLTDHLRALIRTNRADLLAALSKQPSVEAQLITLVAELAEITGDFTADDQREAVVIAMTGQFGAEGWIEYLRDVLVPEERARLH